MITIFAQKVHINLLVAHCAVREHQNGEVLGLMSSSWFQIFHSWSWNEAFAIIIISTASHVEIWDYRVLIMQGQWQIIVAGEGIEGQ